MLYFKHSLSHTINISLLPLPPPPTSYLQHTTDNMPTTHHEPLGGLSPSACVHDPVCLDRYGYLDYLPSLPANIFLLSIFSLYFLIHLVLFTLKYRFTWTYLLANFLGLSLEIIGYVGRVFLHYHVFDQTYFIIYLIGLTIAPAFLSAAIYVSLSRIIPIYTSPNSTKPLTLLPAKTITVSFIACDVVSLILQAVGGALAALAVNDDKSTTSGVRIMIAGLTTQVVATTAFCIVCGHLMWSVRAHPERVNTDTTSFRRSNRFRGWLIGIFSPPFPLCTALSAPMLSHSSLPPACSIHIPCARPVTD